MANITRVERVLVGKKEITDTPNALTTGVLSDIRKGEIVLVAPNQKIIDAAANGEPSATYQFNSFHVAQGYEDGKFVLSSEIKLKDVITYKEQAFSDRRYQTFLIGQDGAGTITGIQFQPDKTYGLRVYLKDNHRLQGTRPTMYQAFFTTGNLDADDDGFYDNTKKVVFGLQTLIHGEEYGHGYLIDYVKVQVSTSAAGAAISTAAVGDGNVGNTGVKLAFGADVLVFDGDQTAVIEKDGLVGFGTGAGSVYYLVKDVYLSPDGNSTIVKINTPFNYINTSGADVPFLAVTKADADDPTTLYAYQVVGKYVEPVNENIDLYEWVNFDVSLSEGTMENGTAFEPVIEQYKLEIGNGLWEQVRDHEELGKPRWGDDSKRLFYDKRIKSLVEEGEKYTSIIIEHETPGMGELTRPYRDPASTVIFLGDDVADRGDGVEVGQGTGAQVAALIATFANLTPKMNGQIFTL